MRERLVVAAGLALVAIVGALAVVILKFGVARPSPPSLADSPRPEIPGEIVYVSGERCVTYLRASGEGVPREVCVGTDLAGFGLLTWIDVGTVAAGARSDRTGRIEIDLQSGAERRIEAGSSDHAADEGWFSLDPALAPSGDRATIDGEGRLFISNGARRQEIADFAGPGWRIQVMLWSPNSEWLVLAYAPPRHDFPVELWIVRRDGAVKGTLARNWWGRAVSWRIEGVGVAPKVPSPR